MACLAALVLPALLALVLRPLGAMAGPLVDADVGPMTQVVTSRTCTTHEVPRNAYTTGGCVRLRLSLLCACLWSVSSSLGPAVRAHHDRHVLLGQPAGEGQGGGGTSCSRRGKQDTPLGGAGGGREGYQGVVLSVLG